MFEILLSLHSVFRWIVLFLILFALINAIKKYYGNIEFSTKDAKLNKLAVLFLHLQFLIGLVLYFLSPIVSSFWANIKDSMKIQELRFFGIEHTLIMLIGVVFITIGSARSKRMATDKSKHKQIFIWFLIGLILIFFSIPWSFLPFNPLRPMQRMF